MTELAQASRLLQNLPKNNLTQFPSGKWGFNGSVRADLCYRRKDGAALTPEDISNVRHFGPRLAGVVSVVFDTADDAMAAV